MRSIAAAKARRGGHDGAGWPGARAWDRVADLADLLADGDGLKSAAGWLGGLISSWKLGLSCWTSLADVPSQSAAAIADIHASSWPSKTRRLSPRDARICDAGLHRIGCSIQSFRRKETTFVRYRLASLAATSESRRFQPAVLLRLIHAPPHATIRWNSDLSGDWLVSCCNHRI